MKKAYTLFIYVMMLVVTASAQDRVVQNRPYTDLRPFHFGIVVGANMQDTKFRDVGPHMITLQDGTQKNTYIACDQDNWSMGFNVGVLGELRLNTYFALRLAPQLYFGSRHIVYHDMLNKDAAGRQIEQREDMKTVYVGGSFDLIFASQRYNNHRPYIMAGLSPVFNLTNKGNDYMRLKKGDVFLEVGMGCDFYLPFFKLRPEIKFMYGLTNCLDSDYIANMRDDTNLPFATAVDQARSKMFVLSFYFE